MSKLKTQVGIFIILVIAGFLRFYNLMHDAPFFFNPDERNMAGAISQFRLPAKLSEIPVCVMSQFSEVPATSLRPPAGNCNLNPHFFAYGQFPLYLAFASDQIASVMLNSTGYRQVWDDMLVTSFPSAVFYLRFWSALFSTLTVYFVFLISRQLFNYQLSIITSLLAAFTPGLIQSAHFGTTESLLTFFFLASIYLSLRYLRNLSTVRYLFFTSLSIGLALGSKLTGIFFFVPPFITLMIRIIRVLTTRKRNQVVELLGYLKIGLLLFIGSISFFTLSSPYNLKEPDNFLSAVFGYEKDVAMGVFEAFYTRQFVETTPILFQAEKIFPYALGWPVFILGTLGFFFLIFQIIYTLDLHPGDRGEGLPNEASLALSTTNSGAILKRSLEYSSGRTRKLILFLSFSLYLFPNVFLFAKWTRFMIPILPFFAIFSGYLLFVILGSLSDSRITSSENDSGQAVRRPELTAEWARMTTKFVYWIIGLLVLIGSITPGVAFMSIYTNQDSRVTASRWIYQNIPDNSYILSETANVVDIPLGLRSEPINKNYQVVSFDFYHLDQNPRLLGELLTHLEKSSYIFIPSRRIFANYPRFPQKYPLVTTYYDLLFSGVLGFEKVKEISVLNDESAEETFTVFDHPVIRIYRKIKQLNIEEYRSLFKI